tara:strand:+ start:14968 stop:15177 length:210 start_codon:yes stop_codon:yes gene_type:complete
MELEKKIDKMSVQNFQNFAHNLWIECNVERKNWGEDKISYMDYVINNLQFLYDEYERQKSEQRRKDLDV